MRRFLLSIALAAPLATLACGGDDAPGASSGGATNDAATTPPPGSTTPGSTTPPTNPPPGSLETHAVAGGLSIYLGQSAQIDGSGSTGDGTLTFVWALKSKPDGSALSSASIAGGATNKASFAPDMLGAYTLTLTVTGSGGASSVDAVVTAVDAPVFYFETQNDGGGLNAALVNVRGASGTTPASAVSCFVKDSGPYDDTVDDVSRAASDWWEAPAGSPSRFVYYLPVSDNDGGTHAVLQTALSTDSCASAPKVVDRFLDTGPSGRSFEQPRFSPNGSRIAYTRNSSDGVRVATVGFDGASPHVLGYRLADGDGGQSDGGLGLLDFPRAAPMWMNDGTVVWVQVGSSGWQLVSAADADTPTTTLLLTCTGTVPIQFALLPNDEVLVSQVNGNATDLLVYPMTGGACGTPRNITSLADSSYAVDFAVSPDKKSVAYHVFNASDAGPGTDNMMVAALDKSTPPTAVATPFADTYRGPRWLAGGAFLSWGMNGTAIDAGTGNAIAVIAADGGATHAIAQSSDIGNAYAIGNGYWSCGLAQGVGSGVSFAGILGVLGLRILRRRRAKR